jgi:methionyl-tRNA formyltransferase
MTRLPIRLMFLGNRRIAWEVLKLLFSDPYRSSFDVRAIVTDGSIWQEYQVLNPRGDACFIPSDRRQSAQIRETIKTQAIDVLLSIQYNWIIPGDILDLVGRRAFNLHNARLPDYKGYNSISHAIANRDTSYETTIHWMADEVDSGDLAYVTRTPIQADDTAVSLYIRTIDASISAVKNLLSDLGSGTDLPRTPLSQERGTFYSRDSVDSLANVTGKVDPEDLARIARATFFPPYNTAYFLHDGKKYLLLPESEEAKVMMTGKSVNEPIF